MPSPKLIILNLIVPTHSWCRAAPQAFSTPRTQRKKRTRVSSNDTHPRALTAEEFGSLLFLPASLRALETALADRPRYARTRSPNAQATHHYQPTLRLRWLTPSPSTSEILGTQCDHSQTTYAKPSKRTYMVSQICWRSSETLFTFQLKSQRNTLFSEAHSYINCLPFAVMKNKI